MFLKVLYLQSHDSSSVSEAILNDMVKSFELLGA